MGYGLGIYCEQDVFYKKELIDELNNKFPPDGEYTSFALKTGYYFFGNYRIYNERSWFYQICESINSDFFEYFSNIDYVEDLAEWTEKEIELKWHSLTKVKFSLEEFLDKIRRKDIVESIFKDTSKNKNDFNYDRFKTYLSKENGILEDLLKCQYYIEVYEKYGAKKLLFIYD